MKRALAQEFAEESDRPLEFYYEVARASPDWVLSGQLARTCKSLLQYFTRPGVLAVILDHLKTTQRPLLRWLCIALPQRFMYDAHSIDRLSPLLWKDAQIDLEDYIGEGFHFLITGGCVAQILHGVSWKCDIDIFVEKDRIDERDQRAAAGREFDFVPGAFDELQRELDCFDLSVVQQGFLSTDDRNLYRTPLSLYTECTREIIVIVDDESVFYNNKECHHTDVLPPREMEAMKNYGNCALAHVRKHNGMGHGNPFHDCDVCFPKQSGAITRWRRRICNYRDRFPEYKISYCEPPSNRTRYVAKKSL